MGYVFFYWISHTNSHAHSSYFAYLRNARTTDPSNVKARYIRASSFMKKKKYAKAMKDFDQVLRYKPDDIGSLYNRGVGTFCFFRIVDRRSNSDNGQTKYSSGKIRTYKRID